MPIKDVDAGLVWTGYQPTPFKTPKHFKQPEKPFYQGGSEVPINLTSNLYLQKSGNVGGNPNTTTQPKVVKRYGSFAYVPR